jgi:hypothetical protein
MKQDRIDDAEDGSAGGDPKAESNDRHKGERGRLEELTEGETEIV